MNSNTKDYNNLQASIDKVIGRIGLEKTVFLLESFVDTAAACEDSASRIRMITQYLVKIACDVFALNEESFFKSQVREYRDARMSCFHLLRKYTADSYPKIGRAFYTGERVVMYGINKTTERLEYTKGNPAFVQSYDAMESRLIVFISKLN